MGRFRRSNPSSREFFSGSHRFEHWYRDNTVYFITARCRDRYAAFASRDAQQIFWNRFDHYTAMHGFQPWITTLMSNHYHTVGYLKSGNELGEMMRKIHGSVAKLTNDILPERRVPFWRNDNHNDYFDGCLRDVNQLDRAYRYTRDQAKRAGIVKISDEFENTHVRVDLAAAKDFAQKRNALMSGVPYPRYRKSSSK